MAAKWTRVNGNFSVRARWVQKKEERYILKFIWVYELVPFGLSFVGYVLSLGVFVLPEFWIINNRTWSMAFGSLCKIYLCIWNSTRCRNQLIIQFHLQGFTSKLVDLNPRFVRECTRHIENKHVSIFVLNNAHSSKLV